MIENNEDNLRNDAVWKALDKIKTVEPTPLFRSTLWARIERERDRYSWPTWATASAALVLAGMVGLTGTLLHPRTSVTAPTPTEESLATLTSPLPLNSIEDFIINSTTLKENSNGGSK